MIKKRVLILLSLTLMIAPIFNAFAESGESIDVSVTIDGGSFDVNFKNVQNINFGELNLNEVYEGEGVNKELSGKNVEIKIRDFRGTGEGFKFSVKADRMADGSRELPNGTLSLGKIKVNSSNDDKPTIKQAEKFDGAPEVDLVTFKKGSGQGAHTITFEDYFLKFNLKGQDIKKGEYSTTVIFTLYNTPSA